MSTTSTLGLRLNPTLAIPLVSSSLTVFYAAVETTIFYSFLRSADQDPAATSKVVRLWWTSWVVPGTSLIFAITLPSIIAGSYAFKDLPEGSPQWKLALAGVTFALGHFAFVAPIATTIRDISDEQKEKRGETIGLVRRWLKIHFWRTLLTDLPALASFTWLAFGF